jgi:hypothetical protein
MACNDEVIPLQSRIESDLDEVYATERHLLHVACTFPAWLRDRNFRAISPEPVAQIA